MWWNAISNGCLKKKKKKISGVYFSRLCLEKIDFKMGGRADTFRSVFTTFPNITLVWQLF